MIKNFGVFLCLIVYIATLQGDAEKAVRPTARSVLVWSLDE